MPSSKTWVWALFRPRVNTDVSWPGVPVSTTASPGTSRNASATRLICLISKSCASITLTVAGD